MGYNSCFGDTLYQSNYPDPNTGFKIHHPHPPLRSCQLAGLLQATHSLIFDWAGHFRKREISPYHRPKACSYSLVPANLWNTLLLSELRIVSQFVGYYQFSRNSFLLING